MTEVVRIALEELPDREALERARDAVEAALAEESSALSSVTWDLIGETTMTALRDKLSAVDAIACLAGAWCTAAELRKLARETAAAPDLRKLLPLGQHTISADLHPVVSLNLGPLKLPALRFTVRLKALIDSAILVVAGGRLAGIEAAASTVSAALLYDTRQLSQLAQRKLPITRPLLFAGGIAIPF